MTGPINERVRNSSVGTEPDRPRLVTWNIATLDGRIAVSGSTPAWLDELWTPVKQGFEYVDIAAFHDATVTLTGSNNFVARDADSAELTDGASPSQHAGDFLPAEVMRTATKWMAVIDSRGRVKWSRTEGDGRHGIVLVSASTPPDYLAFLRAMRIPYLIAGTHCVDLLLALQRLRDELHVNTIVSDAGGLLNGALLRAGLVDEVDLQILPVVVGIADAPAVYEGYGLGTGNQPLRLTPIHQEKRPDGSIFLRLIPTDSSPAS